MIVKQEIILFSYTVAELAEIVILSLSALAFESIQALLSPERGNKNRY